LATPMTRLAVMEGRTLAIAAYRTKLDEQFKVLEGDDAESTREGMARTEARIQEDMNPVAAAARRDVDEIITPGEIRPWLEALVRMAYQSTGYRRVKNPRIWSLHDQARLQS
ncbi:MAG: propionyl-CoA carboxylase, partial [Acidobacteriota bacterium]|nr:propionyl-CoA carboxylase [Acidobacteriota bacterium]